MTAKKLIWTAEAINITWKGDKQFLDKELADKQFELLKKKVLDYNPQYGSTLYSDVLEFIDKAQKGELK